MIKVNIDWKRLKNNLQVMVLILVTITVVAQATLYFGANKIMKITIHDVDNENVSMWNEANIDTEDEIYKVKGGDTLWGIAKEHYGESHDVQKVIYVIQMENDMENTMVYLGQKLVLPPKALVDEY